MNVLVCCEESQTVCKAFRKYGHNAYSCDIQDCSGGHPEWHIKGDVIPYINGNCIFETCDGKYHSIRGEWDLLICHPPCTFLSNAATRHIFHNGFNFDRYEKGRHAAEFFMKFYNAKCKRICIENPVDMKIFELPAYDQIVNPYQFGDPFAKRTCLWLKGLEPLMPEKIMKYKNTKNADWFNKGGHERKKNRSKFFSGMADAMARQFGNPDFIQINLI